LESRACQPFDMVMEVLKRNAAEFRAVAVCAHRGQSLPRVERELQSFKQSVIAWCRRYGLRSEIRVLRENDASVAGLERTLRNLGLVHILHFCGHGHHNSERPEDSGLAFLDGGRGYEYVNSRQLLHVFEEAKIWCLFLSCCYSGATSAPGSSGALLSGVVHAALEANVPNILTYRWEVSDEGALGFAEQFYQRLFSATPSSLAVVLRECRRKSDGARIGFDAWASSVLVTNDGDYGGRALTISDGA
jgi:CHAT domain-containing protein